LQCHSPISTQRGLSALQCQPRHKQVNTDILQW
jgi:hypothetical protein